MEFEQLQKSFKQSKFFFNERKKLFKEEVRDFEKKKADFKIAKRERKNLMKTEVTDEARRVGRPRKHVTIVEEIDIYQDGVPQNEPPPSMQVYEMSLLLP